MHQQIINELFSISQFSKRTKRFTPWCILQATASLLIKGPLIFFCQWKERITWNKCDVVLFQPNYRFWINLPALKVHIQQHGFKTISNKHILINQMILSINDWKYCFQTVHFYRVTLLLPFGWTICSGTQTWADRRNILAFKLDKGFFEEKFFILKGAKLKRNIFGRLQLQYPQFIYLGLSHTFSQVNEEK